MKQFFYLNTHKPQVCYKHIFNKILLNSNNLEQIKIKRTVSCILWLFKLIFSRLLYNFIDIGFKLDIILFVKQVYYL